VTHQWLGPNHRRTFWRVTPDGAVCLGYLDIHDEYTAVHVPRGEPTDKVPTDAACLRRCDDAEAGAKTMCAYWRVVCSAST